ncbi:hypothetical protein RAJCM14343_3671 [Rhodococcus aetherivorans]|uniref:Uncharacterized protein n=1 Tax=Rhodococcus aetherivorans TaxID=191292 RepID=A0ABQ0YPA5_9NOCA|nr:hypothetical protein RAJCM14343_3671 [Rhodococcus aetherivorans]CCW13784.1 hypothetical protein EBESD8_43470 [Rhodococcus aetherivorans]
MGRHRGFGGVVFVVDSDLAQGSGLPGLGTHARVERRPACASARATGTGSARRGSDLRSGARTSSVKSAGPVVGASRRGLPGPLYREPRGHRLGTTLCRHGSRNVAVRRRVSSTRRSGARPGRSSRRRRVVRGARLR